MTPLSDSPAATDPAGERAVAVSHGQPLLLARPNVVTALNTAPSPLMHRRAQIRLELLGIVAAVDNSRIDAADAVSLLEGLHTRTLDDHDQKALAQARPTSALEASH